MHYFADHTTDLRPTTATLPRYRTIRECVAELKQMDEHTAITEYFIRSLCKQNKIEYFASGNKSLVSLDSLLRFLGVTATEKSYQPAKQQNYLGDEENYG